MQHKRKRLLLITYCFPPDNPTASRRSARVARTVARMGWDVDVLTIERRDDSAVGKDVPTSDLLAEGNLGVFRTAPNLRTMVRRMFLRTGAAKETSGESGAASGRFEGGQASGPGPHLALYRWLHDSCGYQSIARQLKWPDPMATWLPFVLAKAWRLIRDNDYDVLMTNSYPYTSHLAGLVLKRLFDIPWVMDMRDGWALDEYETFPRLVPIPWHRRLHSWLMDRVAARAQSIWNLTPPITQAFVDRYLNDMDTDKFVTVFQGIDLEELPRSRAAPPRDHFVISYTGHFYSSIPNEGLLEALRLLRSKLPGVERILKLKVHSSDSTNAVTRAKVRQYQVQELFEFGPLLSEKEMFELLFQSTVQLVLGGNNPWTKKRLTTKLFDYLATGRPILALVTDDSAISQVIHETRSGWCVPPDRPDLIAGKLRGLITTWQKNQGRLEVKVNARALSKYSLSGAVGKLMLSELERVTDRRRSGSVPP